MKPTSDSTIPCLDLSVESFVEVVALTAVSGEALDVDESVDGILIRKRHSISVEPNADGGHRRRRDKVCCLRPVHRDTFACNFSTYGRLVIYLAG